MPSKLEQLRKVTTVVADTGDIEAIKRLKPHDATTNPSLLYKAAQLSQYQPLLKESINWAKNHPGSDQEQVDNCSDKLAILIGKEILDVVPGYISTEVDARLSFDTTATINRARRLIRLYEENDVKKDRVLIKIAATWEGIRAAEVLQQEGVNCNLTLVFSFEQALASAQAGGFLISPFVGRILDWHKKQSGRNSYPAHEDPGVLSVQEIYNHFKQHQYSTIVMGASFRNTEEIEQLAGCDRLTISPQLMDELNQSEKKLDTMLSKEIALAAPQNTENYRISENKFRWQMNENAMATEKLAEGIRNFTIDQIKLEKLMANFKG
ncbi:MAG: transaldolase [Pseudomonadales bacterium]|nr:transaldolase [Pseudomonadales bacterium]